MKLFERFTVPRVDFFLVIFEKRKKRKIEVLVCEVFVCSRIFAERIIVR